MNILITKDMEYIILSLREFGHNINILEDINIMDGFHDISSYDIVILDTKNHLIDSFELSNFIRKKYDGIGIIFITDDDDLKTKLMAFSNGADDYINIKTSILEINARLKGIHNRCKNVKNLSNVLILGDLKLDYETRTASRQGNNIVLTTKEFLLLEYFMKHKNIMLTKNQIKEQIWGIDFVSDTNIVEVYMSKLRNKIDKNYKQKFFHTIRGAGYIFRCK